VNFGILKENPVHERRVALTPAGVQTLVSSGNQVYIEKEAGVASHFTDEEYRAVGGTIVYTRDEVFGRSEVLMKISSPTDDDCEKLVDSQTLLTFLHLAIARTRTMETLLRKKICAVGFELIEDLNGDLPILQVMSEIAGQMSTQIAARFLESSANGRGIVMGGITGVPPATVLIIGAGTVGAAAARTAFALGAEVIVLDRDLSRLRSLQNRFDFRIATAIANDYNIRKAMQYADVVIGAVLIKAERAPHVISEEMIQQMKPGSIVVDVSIDQGGCIATSRPTTLENPTYMLHNVVHYCVPNIPANAARTATYGLTNALLPMLNDIAEKGIDGALIENPGLARGVCTFRGACTQDAIARRFEIQPTELFTLLKP
jgi:alanine dehydrogenase